jgi:hypothetical protein
MRSITLLAILTIFFTSCSRGEQDVVVVGNHLEFETFWWLLDFPYGSQREADLMKSATLMYLKKYRYPLVGFPLQSLTGQSIKLPEREDSPTSNIPYDLEEAQVETAIRHFLHPSHKDAERILELELKKGFNCTAWGIKNFALKGNDFWEKINFLVWIEQDPPRIYATGFLSVNERRSRPTEDSHHWDVSVASEKHTKYLLKEILKQIIKVRETH